MLVLLLESYRSYEEQLQEYFNVSGTRGTKSLLKVLKNLTPRNVSVSSKDILAFLYDGHSISFTVASIMEGLDYPTMWGSTVAKKPGRVHPNLRSASKKTVKMPEIILISM